MANHSLYTRDGQSPTQEMTMQAQMLVQIECELLQVQADQRTKLAEKGRVKEELAKIDGLEKDLRARPIFRAIENNVDMAFVPYTQLKGIQPNAQLMDCILAIFNCHKVGTVDSIVPGETILPDPFGSGQVRGQFITLVLNKNNRDDAMQSKILRVRF
jgi:hypothetical protein